MQHEDERDAFEAWHNEKHRWMSARDAVLKGNYADHRMQERWAAWQARAALAQAQQSEDALKDIREGYEGAKVEVHHTGLGATLLVYYVNEGCAEAAKDAIAALTGSATP